MPGKCYFCYFYVLFFTCGFALVCKWFQHLEMREVGFSSYLSHTSWMLSPEQSAKHMADAETCLSNDSPFLVISEKGEVNDSQLPSWRRTMAVNIVQFSRLVMSNSLRSHGLWHTRPPCPSPTPRVYSNSCPLSRWYHPTISSCVVPFCSHLQSFPPSVSFQMSQFFASSGQSTGVSASASVLPMNIQGWFPLGWTGWISLLSTLLTFNKNNTLKDNFAL